MMYALTWIMAPCRVCDVCAYMGHRPAGSVMYALTWILDLAWSVLYALTRKVALAKSFMYAHTWNMALTWTMAKHETLRRGTHTYQFYVNFESSHFSKFA